MPYSQNQRYGFCEIKLNTSWVQEAIEEMGYEYNEEICEEDKSSYLHMYVRLLEVAFNKFVNFHKKVDFDEWFLENYYSSDNCATFHNLFMEREESEGSDESEESEDEEEEEGSKCGECGVSTQGRKIRSLWNNTLCEKCGEESEDEEEFDNDKLKTYNN